MAKLPVLVQAGLAELYSTWGTKLCKQCHKLIVIKHAHTPGQIIPEQQEGGSRTGFILTSSNTQGEDVCSTVQVHQRESSSR